MGVWTATVERIADPAVRELARRGEVRSYPKGSVLIREAEEGGALYVVLAGRVKVYVSDSDGRELIVGHYGPTEYVGEMSLDGEPRSASVSALEATVCVVVDRDALRAAIAAEPDIALEMLSRAFRRTRSATTHLKNLALMDVYGRVARLLLSLEYVPEADGLSWSRERLTQQEIARRVGASRDMISRILKDLRTGGYVRQQERRFTIIRHPPARW